MGGEAQDGTMIQCALDQSTVLTDHFEGSEGWSQN